MITLFPIWVLWVDGCSITHACSAYMILTITCTWSLIFTLIISNLHGYRYGFHPSRLHNLVLITTGICNWLLSGPCINAYTSVSTWIYPSLLLALVWFWSLDLYSILSWSWSWVDELLYMYCVWSQSHACTLNLILILMVFDMGVLEYCYTH